MTSPYSDVDEAKAITKQAKAQTPPSVSPTRRPTTAQNPGRGFVPTPVAQLGPPAPVTGKVRYDQLLAAAPALYAVGSAEWDRWLIGQRGDPSDPEYQQLLEAEKQRAIGRMVAREEQRQAETTRETRRAKAKPTARRVPPEHPTGQTLSVEERRRGQIQEAARASLQQGPTPPTSEQEARDLKANPAQATMGGAYIVTANGTLIPIDPRTGTVPATPKTAEGRLAGAPAGGDQQVVLPNGETGWLVQQPKATEMMERAKTEGSQEELGDVRNGGYVYIGNTPGTLPRGTVNANAQVFMSVEEAYNIPASWSPEHVAAIQDMLDMPVTGYPDMDLYKEWKETVDSAARLTMAGRNIDPNVLWESKLNQHVVSRGRGGGGGGGGGSGGGAGFNRSQVRGFLNTVMRDQVGREASDAEADRFFAALNGAGDVDPQQFAVDWIRGNMTGEAGAYSAINYYDVIMQLLAGG